MERTPGGGGPVVAGFGAKGFRIGEDWYSAVLLTVEAHCGWEPPLLDALDLTTLEPLIAMRPEFILLGTGATLKRPPVALTAALEARNIGLEPMDSRAAARGWGVLRSEGRQVAAALYPLD